MGDDNNIEPTPPQNAAAAASGPEPSALDTAGAATAEEKAAAAKGGLTPGQRLAAKRGKKAQQKQDLKAELKRKEEDVRTKEQEEAERFMGVRSTPLAPDAVQETASNVTSYMQDHRGRIVGGVLAVLAAGLLVVFGQSYFATGSAEQAELLASAIEITNAKLDPSDTDGKDESGKPVFKTDKDRATKAAAAFAAAAKPASDSTTASWARLGQASALTSAGKASEAVAVFAGVLSAQRERPALGALALEGQGIALDAAGKADEAMKRFEELKTYDSGAYKDLAEYHIARLMLAKGQRDEAKTLLKAVYDRLGSPAEGAPKSRYLKGEVEARLSELDSSLVPAGGGEAQQFSQEEIQRLIQQLQQKGGAPAGAGGE